MEKIKFLSIRSCPTFSMFKRQVKEGKFRKIHLCCNLFWALLEIDKTVKLRVKKTSDRVYR